MHPVIPISLVFLGCCSNVVFLEYIVKEFPAAGNIITFAQFLLISLEGFIFTTKFGRVKPVIPIRTYIIMVTLFFAVQVVNNMAFGYNIAVTLHIIFRSGSLIANMVLGIIILKRSYKLSKYLSVIMITAGIIICTIMSAQEVKPSEGAGTDEEKQQGMEQFVKWLIGVGMLTFALFMSARMGIYQEQVYSKHGKHPNEALFYNHTLPLPGFILVASDIYNHALLFSSTEPFQLPGVGVGVPYMWLMLLGNAITQYICIKGVFILTTECTSLTVTLVVTLRKFTSLLFSIWYFSNPFTIYHWLGTIMVFGGTLVFTETFHHIRVALQGDKEKTH